MKCKITSKTIEPFMNFGEMPIANGFLNKDDFKNEFFYKMEVGFSEDMSLLQLNEFPKPEKMFNQNYPFFTGSSLFMINHFKEYAAWVKKTYLDDQSKLIEIGSNDGTLLNFIKTYGCEVLGVDPAKELAKKSKCKTIVGKFNTNLSQKIKKNYGLQDLIIANNVIANIDDLKDVFKGISGLLKPKGYFVMETFSLKGVVEKNLLDNIYHEHLSYFTIKNLVRFAKKFGLNIFSADHLLVKGGSIRFIFSKQKKKINKKDLEKNMIVEKKLGLGSPVFFQKLKLKNNIIKQKILSFIESKKNKKKKFAGFGASIGTTTLLYEFGLGKKISYLFDDEKRRHNLYSPGYKIKVLNPCHMKKFNLDYIIIFAWRYSKIIIKRNKENFTNKIKIIIPLPKLRIKKSLC